MITNGKYSPAIRTAIDINELVMFNANPVLSVMSVLKTIPSDSPQLTMLNETSAITKYIDTDRCRFTATMRRENRKPEAISNGISRMRYTKKNELTEYALSACSYEGIRKQAGGRKTVPPYPVEGISFQRVLANVLQQANKVHLSPGKLLYRQYHENKID